MATERTDDDSQDDAAAPPSRPRRSWTALAIPGVLIVGLAADGASRFLRIDGLAIRAWEALTRNAFTEGGVPFEPSRRFVKERAFGDLAAMTNQPALREYRRELFTTDAWGYRNAEAFTSDRPPDAILVGSSFGAGSGVSDHETLSARLAARTGRRFYNAAGGTPSPARIREIAARLGMRSGWVLYELYEPNGFPAPPPAPARRNQLCYDRLGVTCLRAKGWMRASPLEIVAKRAHRLLEDDVWLPNASAGGRPPPRLTNGIPMLFGERARTTCPHIADDAARAYFRWFQAGLPPGLRLLVVLVPGKYTVYGDLSDLPADPSRGAEPCPRRIAAALDALHIPFTDVTVPLRRAARDGFAGGDYVYFRDDTHWNARGIDVAAAAVAATWPP